MWLCPGAVFFLRSVGFGGPAIGITNKKPLSVFRRGGVGKGKEANAQEKARKSIWPAPVGSLGPLVSMMSDRQRSGEKNLRASAVSWDTEISSPSPLHHKRTRLPKFAKSGVPCQEKKVKNVVESAWACWATAIIHALFVRPDGRGRRKSHLV